MTCATCSAEVERARVFYDHLGNATCARCFTASQVAAGHHGAAMKLKKIAYGVPAIGLAAYFFNPFLLMSFAAIGNGIYVLASLRKPDTAMYLEDTLEKIKVAAIAGTVLGGITAALGLLNMIVR